MQARTEPERQLHTRDRPFLEIQCLENDEVAVVRREIVDERDDAEPLVPGEPAELTFQLWPTSVLFRAGHRIRVAIAGADAGTFERLPAEGTPTIRVEVAGASFLELPVVRAR